MKIILRGLLLGSYVTVFAAPSCTKENPIEQCFSNYNQIITILKECFSEFETAFSKNSTEKERLQVVHTCFKPLRNHIQSLSLDAIQKSKHPITGTTLLMLGVQLADLELIAILLKKGVNVNEENRSGISAFNLTYELSYEAFIEIATVFLNHGANINHFDAEGNTTAHAIARRLAYLRAIPDQATTAKKLEKKLEFLKTHGANFALKNIHEVSVDDILTSK